MTYNEDIDKLIGIIEIYDIPNKDLNVARYLLELKTKQMDLYVKSIQERKIVVQKEEKEKINPIIYPSSFSKAY